MKLVSYKDVTYRDMPYKMVMTNSSGDTAFLYDTNKHMTIMTPFKYDERKIDNPELMVSLDELVDNLIHGDLHQSENYTNIIENNIEQLGELELEDEDRLYLTEVICTWAKRSKYVQQFEKEFEKIGIDISNILYEIDPEYNDLLDSCKKSEEKKLEDLKKDEKTEVEVQEEKKEENLEESSEEKAPEGLEEIDPEMQEEVEKEMKESKPDELKDEKVENDNKEIENPELNQTGNTNQSAEGSTTASGQQEAEIVAPVEQVSAVKDSPSERPQEEQQEDEKKTQENQQATVSTDPVSEVTTNPVRLTSEYELIQPYVEPMAELMNSAWISLVFYDVDRTPERQKDLCDRLDYAIKNSVTKEEAQYIKDVIDKWYNTGGIMRQDERLYSIATRILDNRIPGLSEQNVNGVFVRDVRLLFDDANRWLSELDGEKKNDHLEYASTCYKQILTKIKSASSEVSKESIEKARELASKIAKKISSTSVEISPEELEGNFMQKFNKESYEISQLLEMNGKGGPRKDDLEYINWKFDKLRAMCRHMPADSSPADKRIVADFMLDMNNYLKQFENNGLNNQYLDNFMSLYKKMKSSLEEYEYYRKHNGIDTDRLELLSNIVRRTLKELEVSKEHMTVEQYRQYNEELANIRSYTRQEQNTVEEFQSMTRRF